MKKASHHPSHRSGGHRGDPDPRPRRWTSGLLALMLVIAGLLGSAPVALAALGGDDPTATSTPSLDLPGTASGSDGAEPEDTKPPADDAASDDAKTPASDAKATKRTTKTGRVGSARPARSGAKTTAAAPGNPGIPQPGDVIYTEDFENGQTGPLLSVDTYVGAQGQPVDADPNYKDWAQCNGWIPSWDQPAPAYPTVNCSTSQAGSELWVPILKALGYVLGRHNGDAAPGTNHVVVDGTNPQPGSNYTGVLLESSGIDLPSAGRFVTFAVDTAEYPSCGAAGNAQDRFELLDGASVIPLSSTPYSLCTDPDAQSVQAPDPNAPTARVGTFTGDRAFLLTSPTVGYRITNAQATGAGNDQAFDNFRILDVTPQLDKSFSPASVAVGGTSTLTFTVTNTSELAAKDGWAFTDTLPNGLTVTGATTGGTCDADVSATGSTISATDGKLAAGEVSCTITVPVTSSTAGSYDNCAANISDQVGINDPACATMTVVPPTPWECTSNAPAYLFQYSSGAQATSVIPIDMVSGATGTPSTIDGREINALAYNPADDYIYGWDQVGNGLLRIASNNTVSEVTLPGGVPANISANGFNTAEFDADGVLWIGYGGSGVTDFSWMSVDLDPDSATYLQVLDSGTTPLPGGQLIGDWAFSTMDDALYSVTTTSSGASDVLVRFDTTTGQFTTVDVGLLTAPDGTRTANSWGAVYADTDGYIYAQDNATGYIFRADPTSGTAEFFAFGPVTSLNDGARCLSDLPIDFGDAPDTYGTLLKDNGPRHGLSDDLRLGASVDDETDGEPNAPADGDGADEDGVADPIELTVGQPTTVTVSATNDTNQPATLVGWIDLDGDGTFGNGPERVIIDVPANSGTASYDLTFPAASAFADTYARFRLFPGDIAGADALPTGPAAAGEVEDYPVTTAPVTPPEQCTPEQTRATERWWFFGDHGGIDFGNSGTTATPFVGDVATQEGSTVVTDTNGALQFWSNGATVFDRNGNPMPNGADLLGQSGATQTVAAFPALGQPGIYYVVTTTTETVNAPNGRLHYSVVDMSLNGGLGDVTTKNVQLGAPGTASEALTAVPNADGTGFWVLTYTNNSPDLLAYEFDANGPTGSVVTSVLPTSNLSELGSLYFSADLTQLVALTANHTETIVRLLAFDADTGSLGERMSWTLPSGAGTGEVGYTADFSPSGDYVYASKIGANAELYRYRIAGATTSAEVKGTEERVGSTGTAGGHVRRGPDGRMYVANAGSATLNVVNDPDDPTDPGYVQGGFALPAGSSTIWGLPQMVTGCPPPVELDYGDAPNTFGTDLASGGPRHTVTPGLTIGSKIDVDSDGQPTADATGDDANGTADEDAFPTPLVLNPGVTSASVTVPVTNTTGKNATLSGWVDANNNGRFDPSEFASVTVPDGATSVDLAFTGLAALQDGTTPMVRLRLTTDALTDNPGTPVDERALGAASDGEVEDHQAQVATQVPVSCVNPFTETFGTGAGYGAPLPAGQTTYSWEGNQPGQDGLVVDGEYALLSTLNGSAGFFWHTGQDHTPGDTDGRMMVVNASYGAGIFFQRTFTGLSAGAKYDFSAWIANGNNIGSVIPPNVKFRVVDPATGAVLAETNTGDIPNKPSLVWERFALQFSATQSTVRLEVVNNGPGGDGNDLTLDDISFTPVCEFSDAPARYGTTIAGNGASHIAAGPTLGTERDSEIDGQPNAAADGDDAAGAPDDEDGVSAPIAMSVGGGTTVSVSATNDSDEDVTLAGWVDLNGDGVFGATERVTVTVPANSGTDDYDLVFPAVSTTTDTYARFRIYGEDVADPQPTGTASAGEVEDYPVTVLDQSLAITKSSTATADSRPGDTITYTVTATNNGPGDYTAANPARVFDDLSGVLDDADYQGDASADRAPTTPSYTAPTISWAGAMAAGESVTITYTVTLKGGGDGTVRNVAFGVDCDPADQGCDATTPACDPPVGGLDPDTGKPCAEVETLLPKLSIDKSADHTDLPALGQTVTYTVTVTNEGPGDYTAAKQGVVRDDLTAVLDDTTDPANVTASVGTAAFDDETSTLTWTGVLPHGESATITYQVTYEAGGDHSLVNQACVPVTEAQDESNPCAEVHIPGAGLDHDKVSDPVSGTAVVPGEVITYTLRFANTGNAPADVDTFDDLSDVLDDADFVTGSIDSDNGLNASYDQAQQRIDITGTVPVGDTLEVTYQVKVRAFADQGDSVVRNALACEPGDAADCEPETTEHKVRALEIEKSSDQSNTTVVGDTVTYQVTATNLGAGDYTAADPARVLDDLSGVLDDADYQGDAATTPAGVGTIDYTSPVIEWSGALAHGDTVTLTYTVKLKSGGDLNVRNVAFGVGCDPADASCDATTPACDPPNQDGVDPDTGQPCAEVEFGLPRMIDEKSVDPADRTAVKAGDVLTYTLRFSNTGTAGGVVSKDDYLGMLLDDAEITSGPTLSGQGSLSADLIDGVVEVRGRLGAGDVTTVTYEVTVKSDADRVAAGADDQLGNFLIEPGTTPPTACEPAAEEDSTCNPVSRIVDHKSVDPADGSAVKAGDTVTYTLTFENLGKGAGTVTKDDYLGFLLDDATFETGPTVSTQAPGSTLVAVSNQAGDRIKVSGDLAAGDTVTVTYTVKVKSDADRVADGGDDQLGNVLIPSGTTPPTTPDCADEDATCNPVSRIVDHKSVDPADGRPVEGSDVLTYTLTFENLGKGSGTVSKDDALGMLLDDAEITAGPVVAVTGGDGDVDATVDGDLIEVRGDLDAGATATITYSVTVKSDGQRAADGGDDVLGNFLIEPGTTPPTECEDVAEEDSTCNPVRELSITKSSDQSVGATFGDVVTYTVTGTNTGRADYTTADPALVRDILTGVLDDAVYNDDAVADVAGTVLNYNSPIIRWEGALGIGEKVTITYTVTLKKGGDGNVRNVAWGGHGSDPACDPATADGFDPVTGQPCGTVEFGRPDLVDSKSVDPKSGAVVVAGQTLSYTLTFTNNGTAPGMVDKVDDLSGVLDDAALVAPPVASTSDLKVGAVKDGRFAVTGTLKPGQTVTVTYGVQVKAPNQMGDKSLGNYLLKPGQKPPVECVSGEDTTCNPVSDITMVKTVDPKDGSKVRAGDKLTYTLAFTNTGKGAGTVDAVDDLSGVLDDATLVTGSGKVSDPALRVVKKGSKFRVRGTLAGGQTVTVTYTVKVKAYGDQGNHALVNFLTGPHPSQVSHNACTSGDPLCTRNPVEPPQTEGNFLASTGGPALWALAGGLILLLGGFVLLGARRRREGTG